MSNAIVSLSIGVVLCAACIGYFYQRRLPEPPPKIVGIDLGTTFSSIALYHAVSGDTQILADKHGHRSIPSVVAFLLNGTVLVGDAAVAQAEHNPAGTIYDSKRFIGRKFDEASFQREKRRYPFEVELDENAFARFVVPVDHHGNKKRFYPEDIGGFVIGHLRSLHPTKIDNCVLTVPAEFDEIRRNASARAVQRAGMNAWRLVSEPTAAALAYGLHERRHVDTVIVVDLGGGTLDVSILWLQGGLFVTRAMAGNNRLGGQDFNERVLRHLMAEIRRSRGVDLTDAEDIQSLRLAVEQAKLMLTDRLKASIHLHLSQIGHFHYELTRDKFEQLNDDLFARILHPISAALEDDGDLQREDVDEIVLVGGSTRVPAVRRVVGEYFGRMPNFGVDPELAVVTGAAVQAGVMGNSWPLTVAAIELDSGRRKVHIYDNETVGDAVDEL